jgi:uncharacterized protein involved in outer membrane biogenesis
VRIRGFKLYNPQGFPQGVILDIPEISVDYDLSAILKKKLHLYSVVINLNEVGIVKDKEKRLNVDSLKVAHSKKKPKEKEGEPSEKILMQIDKLTLSIGKVVYKDFADDEIPTVLVYNLGIEDRSYENLTSAEQLVALMLLESLEPTAIKGAAIYEASAILGVGLVPLGIAGVLAEVMGKDSVKENFKVSFDKAYNVSLEMLKKTGEVKKEDRAEGIIKAKLKTHSITVKIEKISEKATQITVSARKFLKPEIPFAGGVLYQISEKVN